MSIQILGTSGGFIAGVDSLDRLQVRALAETSIAHHSSKKSSASYWNSTYSATGGEEVIYIQNTESRKLHLSKMIISSSVTSLWTLFRVTSATAAAGTAITPVNPSLSGGTPGQENSFGNASVTGSLSGDTLLVGSIGVALVDDRYDFGGAIILNENDAVALTLTTTGVPQVHIEGYWA